MFVLENVVKPYPWGSCSAIADLQGRPVPTGTPEAELWMGAHPGGSSRVNGRPLGDLIAEDPQATLGSRVVSSLGPELPFLLKVLAAAEPLSLQAHPTKAQAEAGYAADDLAQIALDAHNRNYKDRNHKPELLCALSPFSALCGFRPVERTLALLDELRAPTLASYIAALREHPDAAGLRRVFTALMQTEAEPRAALVRDTLAGCREAMGGRFASECGWALRLGDKYPGDIGIVTSLLLNLVELAPGSAIFLPAGNLHAYLEGVGVELMASSDNVLRGGLTPKHVNVPELLRVLDFTPLEPPVVAPREVDGELVYDTQAAEFRLSRIELQGGAWVARVSGPEIVLATAGELTVDALPLARGSSVFVPATTGRYTLRGAGTAFRACVPGQ